MKIAKPGECRIAIVYKNHFSKLFVQDLFFLFIMFFSVNLLYASEEKVPGVNCDIQHGACTKELPDSILAFDISPKPVKAMTDLTFRITLSGKQPVAAPYIDLGMPGMDMGPNRVFLKPAGNGAYEGRGVIVRCPSGRNIWRAAVAISGAVVAEFIFNVVY